MSEQKDHQRSEQYKSVRDKFDDLPLEEKASFLVEAMFSTITRGIEYAGAAFSEELNSIFEQAREAAERAKEQHEASGPASNNGAPEGEEPHSESEGESTTHDG